ncbi:MAG: Ig-like domain repeat protein [Acidimicrobiia bacterium]
MGTIPGIGAANTLTRSVFQVFDDGDPERSATVPLSISVATVACATSDRCFAVGSGVVQVDDGEPGTYTTDPAVFGLSDVDCPADDYCIAVGRSTGGEAVIVEIEDGDPQPAQVLPGVPPLQAVGCWSPTRCVAGADLMGVAIRDGVVTTHPGPLLMRYWGIDCVSSTICFGAGDAANDLAVVAFVNGAPQPVERQNLNDADYAPGIWTGIQCSSTTSCKLARHADGGVIVQTMPTALATTALTTSETPAEPANPPTFTATVAGGDGSGTVRFMESSDPVNDDISRTCSAQPLTAIGNGRFRATCTPDVNRLEVGTYSVIARYTGDSVVLAAQSPELTQVISVPSVSVGDVWVVEGDSGSKVAQFTITLSSAAAQPVTVKVTTAPGSATTPADYFDPGAFLAQFGFPATVTIPAGQVTGTYGVTITGDLLDEPAETFTATVSLAPGSPPVVALGDASAVMTITDDDHVTEVTDLVPDSGPSTGGTEVTVTGYNLAQAAALRVGGVVVPFAVSGQNLVFTTPAALPDAVHVVVTGPDGDSKTHPGSRYTYL